MLGGGVQVGPPDDLLWVYTRNPDGTLSGPIWMKSEAEGLRSHNVPLLEESSGMKSMRPTQLK